MNSFLEKHYYDPRVGFISASKLYQKVKLLDTSITLNDVKQFIKNQATAQINKPIHKPKHYNTIISPSVGNNFQMDLMIYDRYTYHNYKYILVVVDVYSRYALARPLTNRTLPNIMNNMIEIFDEMGIPKNINTDNEFNKKLFNDYAKEHHITTFFSQPDEPNKNAIVERLNRTIAEVLQRWRIATGKHNWYKVLPEVMENYNNTRHTTLKATPSDVFHHLDTNHQIIKKVIMPFKVNDRVRILSESNIFSKGDIIKYSKEIYTIERIDKNRIFLNGLDNYFKSYQLQRIQKVESAKDLETSHEPIHKEIQHNRKIKRVLSKEGIERTDIALRRSARERKVNQLEDIKYGKLIY